MLAVPCTGAPARRGRNELLCREVKHVCLIVQRHPHHCEQRRRCELLQPYRVQEFQPMSVCCASCIHHENVQTARLRQAAGRAACDQNNARPSRNSFAAIPGNVSQGCRGPRRSLKQTASPTVSSINTQRFIPTGALFCALNMYMHVNRGLARRHQEHSCITSFRLAV